MKQWCSTKTAYRLAGTQSSIMVKFRKGIIRKQCTKCFCLFDRVYCECDPRYKSVFQGNYT